MSGLGFCEATLQSTAAGRDNSFDSLGSPFRLCKAQSIRTTCEVRIAGSINPLW
jgi:hypothetical protein